MDSEGSCSESEQDFEAWIEPCVDDWIFYGSKVLVPH